MLRAAGWPCTSVWYTVLAALQGTGMSVRVHCGFDTLVFSPRSVSATIFLVLLATPDLLVTQISTRLMVMPVVRFGKVFMAAS